MCCAIRSETPFLRTDVDTSNDWEVDYFRRPYGLFLLFLVFACEHGLHKSIQRGFQIANGLFGLAMLDRLLDTVFNVVLQDSFAHLVEPGTNCGNLRQHVVTLTPLFPQTFEAVGMTSDACEPLGDVFA